MRRGIFDRKSGSSPAYAGVEEWLDRHVARVGIRYLSELLAVSLVWTLVVFLLGVGGLTLYFEGSTGDFVSLLALAYALTVIFLPVGFAVWARRSRPVLSWLRGERSQEAAPAAWEATLAAPLRLPLTVYSIALPIQAAWTFYAAAVLDTGLESVPAIFLATATLTLLAVGGVAVFGSQLTIRPVLRDIVAYLPTDFAFVPSRYGLARQLIIRLTVLGMTMTFVGGGVAVISDDPLTRFTLGFTVAPAVLVLLGAFAFPLAALSLVGPVKHLITATRRVAAGDFTAQVPVVTSDELGELSHSFNTMTGDLRRMTEDLRESRARIVAASDASRREVERDLHDGAQQDLVLLNLKLALIEKQLARDPETAAAVGEAREDLRHALGQLRDLAHGIYPAVLENDGLPGALEDAARRAALPARVECDGAGRYPRELEAAIYFCCLEALQNAGKHAGEGAHATVRLAADRGTLSFEVADDGAGFEVPAKSSSAGLQNMADRVGALGGTLQIASTPGGGTRVSGRVPLA